MQPVSGQADALRAQSVAARPFFKSGSRVQSALHAFRRACGARGVGDAVAFAPGFYGGRVLRIQPTAEIVVQVYNRDAGIGCGLAGGVHIGDDRFGAGIGQQIAHLGGLPVGFDRGLREAAAQGGDVALQKLNAVRDRYGHMLAIAHAQGFQPSDQ